MIRRLILLYFAFAVPFSFAEQEWVFPMPAYFGGLYLGEINVFTDGEIFFGVPANELKIAFDSYLNDETEVRLSRLEGQKLTPQKLKELDIEVKMDARRLIVEIEAGEGALLEQHFAMSGDYTPPKYTQHAFFAWHNNFNFTYSHNLSSGADVDAFWLGEWLIGSNIGGANGLNLESSMYALGDQSSLDSDTTLYRGDTFLFVDRASIPLRISAGDLNTNVAGHLPSISMGGLGIERLWSELQPNRTIQNGGSQTVNLRESADIAIYINDIYIRQIRLPPGKYQIDDLPLSQGANDIRLVIRYQSGEREVLNYSQFYNGRLLREGFSDFALYTGVASAIVDRDYVYDEDQYVVHGYYEYGLTSLFTVGVNGAYHPLGSIAGGVVNFGTPIGNFGTRVSGLIYDDVDDIGFISSLDYEHQVWGAYSSPNLRISLERYESYRSLPWAEGQGIEDATSVRTDYTFYFNSDWDLNLSANWLDLESNPFDQYFASAEIRWRGEDINIGVGSNYFRDGTNEDDDLTVFVNFSWTWFSEQGGYVVDVSSLYAHEVSEEVAFDETRLRFEKSSDRRPGDFDYELEAIYSFEQSDRYRARGGYTANRFTTELEYDYVDFDDFTSQRIISRSSTAVSFIGGDIAWGRNYYGPAAIVKVHDSLDVPVNINTLDERPDHIATTSLDALVGINSAHSESVVTVDIPEAPIGYDYGSGYNIIVAGTYTGHIITVGSNASKTVIGKLVDESGNNIALRNGVVILESGEERLFFTNSGGRFALERMVSGTFRIELRGTPHFVGKVTIDDNDENLIYLKPVVVSIKDE
ncbi:fimbria/pilus outer membrane usher protein [Vibrio breoganii]|uniref:fimbria/pilus outer membrane usher protein n=1 Tax=Vibrio breoganii TaxID=553239 RepID=UPI001056AC6C|nr:fimbria/pilus outer membrane usher protein [Vibrio breoganii]